MQLQLETPVIEVPSDILGVIFTPYDEARRMEDRVDEKLTATEYDIDARAVTA